MTIPTSVHNSKVEAICIKCGNTLVSVELAEYFYEEELVFNFWSCSHCGFQFETEEKVRSEATLQIENQDQADLFPETFFASPRF
jgi:C4-type Zn-finger protein